MTDRQTGKTLLKTTTLVPGTRTAQRVRMGPFTVLTVLAAAAALWTQNWLRKPPAPVILPSRILSSGVSFPASEPGPAVLLHHKELQLDRAQEQRIRKLVDLEQKALMPLLARIDGDEANMDRFVRSARGRGGASPAALQREAALYMADSAELNARRRSFWNQGLAVLTTRQLLRAQRLSISGLSTKNVSRGGGMRRAPGSRPPLRRTSGLPSRNRERRPG